VAAAGRRLAIVRLPATRRQAELCLAALQPTNVSGGIRVLSDWDKKGGGAYDRGES